MQLQTQILTYADQVNSQYQKTTSNYVDIPTRLNSTINGDQYLLSRLSNAKAEFKRRNPTLKKNAAIKLVRTERAKLSDIVIDTTLQRLLILHHVFSIVTNFKQIRVKPICVYQDPMCPGKWVCWDGQHTVVALYIIMCQIMGQENLEDIEVPINIYESNLKSEMRENFIELNGEAVVQLDLIDLFAMKVFGVRCDGSKNADWQLNERKQGYIERAGIFATADKFGDADKPGAWTRQQELCDTNYPEEVTEYFCAYAKEMEIGDNRPVQPKESWIVYDYFDMCVRQGIDIDKRYITEFASAMKKINQDRNGDFDSLYLSRLSKQIYRNYWERIGLSADGSYRGMVSDEFKIIFSYLIPVLKKHMSKPVPSFPVVFETLSSELI